MDCHSTCSTWPTGQNISRWLSLPVEKSWDTVSDTVNYNMFSMTWNFNSPTAVYMNYVQCKVCWCGGVCGYAYNNMMHTIVFVCVLS